MREEPDVFKSRETYNNRNIQDLYDIFQGKERQKLYIFSRKYTPEQL
jgi:hypothetical protein